MSLRKGLVLFQGIAAAVLSFDALYSYMYEATAGQAPAHPLVPVWLVATLWAFVIDGGAVTGILGIRRNWRDKMAWATFLLFAGASFGFQVLNLPPTLAKAVAPVAWVLSVVVSKLGQADTTPATGPAMSGQGPDLEQRARDAYQRNGRSMSGAALAREVGTSERHGRRLLATFRAEELTPASSNGHGQA